MNPVAWKIINKKEPLTPEDQRTLRQVHQKLYFDDAILTKQMKKCSFGINPLCDYRNLKEQRDETQKQMKVIEKYIKK